MNDYGEQSMVEQKTRELESEKEERRLREVCQGWEIWWRNKEEGGGFGSYNTQAGVHNCSN
jgi:hypothetical protein